MTDPLARIAQRWPGRAKLNLVLGEKGYELPTKYVGILVKDFHCSREQINLYFDEMAKEYFLSVGLADPLLRLFDGEVTYRSRFLDDLYAARPPGERRAYPPCLAAVFDMTAVPNIGKARPGHVTVGFDRVTRCTSAEGPCPESDITFLCETGRR